MWCLARMQVWVRCSTVFIVGGRQAWGTLCEAGGNGELARAHHIGATVATLPWRSPWHRNQRSPAIPEPGLANALYGKFETAVCPCAIASFHSAPPPHRTFAADSISRVVIVCFLVVAPKRDASAATRSSRSVIIDPIARVDLP